MSRTFVSVNDVVLVSAIEQARHRLVFIAPGLRPPVAHALRRAVDVVPGAAIHLVLDVDAEVARLGYGDKDFKGMETLQAAAAQHGIVQAVVLSIHGDGQADLAEFVGAGAGWCLFLRAPEGRQQKRSQD